MGTTVGHPPEPPEPELLFPPAVLAVLEEPDAVEVMAVDPRHAERPRPGGFHGYRLRGTARVPTAPRRRAVGEALVAANRTGMWALCFSPRHAVRARRGNDVARVPHLFPVR